MCARNKFKKSPRVGGVLVEASTSESSMNKELEEEINVNLDEVQVSSDESDVGIHLPLQLDVVGYVPVEVNEVQFNVQLPVHLVAALKNLIQVHKVQLPVQVEENQPQMIVPSEVNQDGLNEVLKDDQLPNIEEVVSEAEEEVGNAVNEGEIFEELEDFDWAAEVDFSNFQCEEGIANETEEANHTINEEEEQNEWTEFIAEEFGVNRHEDEEIDDEPAGRNVNEDVYTGEKAWCSDPDDSVELKSLPSDSDEEVESFPHFNEESMMEDPNFQIGMIFADGDQVRRAIRQYAIFNRKKIKLVKNERWRIRAKCAPPCEWLMFVSRKADEDAMQVKTLNDIHTNCRPVFDDHCISSTWLAKHYQETIRYNPRWPLASFEQRVREDFGCQLSRSTLYNALRKARKFLDGDHKRQYQQLYNYCKTLKSVMPGTTCKIDYVEELEARRFRRMYICLAPLKKGFQRGCRTIVCIDACFLSGPFQGQLMVAVGLDANDGFWPIAYAVVEKETKKSWKWFLNLLVDDLGIRNSENWTFMSDQQKVLNQHYFFAF